MVRWTAAAAAAVLALTLVTGRPGPGGAAGTVGDGSPAGAVVGRADGPVVGLPGELTAGSTLPVEVSGVSGDVTLTVLGSWGTAVRSGSAVDGVATFDLPSEITRGTGTLTLVADNGGRVGVGSVTVVSGPVVGPLLPVVGARSIVADGTDRSMVVAIPVDEWGNSIAEGSTVTVAHRDPRGVASAADTTVAHLLGWLELPSGTLAGRGQVWLQAGANQSVTGHQVSLDEVAGPPLPFTLEAVDATLSTRLGADGQTLVLIRSSVLADRYGNVEPDGTLVTVDWDGPGGSSRSSATTISGVAQLSLQAPTVPGAVTLTGVARGTATAAPLTLDFPAVVTDVPVEIRSDDRGLVVTVGPVDRVGGTYVPNGTVATVTLVDTAGHRISGAAGLVDGVVELLLPTSAMVGSVTVTVTVLGARTTVGAG